MSQTSALRSAPATVSGALPFDSIRCVRNYRPVLPLALGLVGTAVSATGSWIPSYWGDEAASVMSAERTLPSLLRLLGHVDAVHGTYYLFLHFWIGAFGASEFSTRFPSAIAAGFIVAGTFLVADRLTSRPVAIAAALACAVFPRIDYVGAETRSYAFSTAAAVWLTLLLLELIERRPNSRLLWAAYGVGMAAGFYVFLYLVLLVPVHAAYLLSTRRFAPVRGRFALAIALAVVLALPIVWLGYQERNQIAFLEHRNYVNFINITVFQWLGNGYLAVAVWALVLLAVVSATLAWRRWHERSELIVLTTLWVLLPTVCLLAVNVFEPTYNLRYLSFSAPALAMLAVAGVFRLRLAWVEAIVFVVVVGLCIQQDVVQRGPYAMDRGADLSQTAALLGSEARPGDAVVFDPTALPSQRPRLALHLYPQDFVGLKDVALKTPYKQRDELWDTTWPLSAVTKRLTGISTVWLLEVTGSKDNTHGTDVHTLEKLGYVEQSKHTVNRTIIYKFAEGN